jgi:hypothetical protein
MDQSKTALIGSALSEKERLRKSVMGSGLLHSYSVWFLFGYLIWLLLNHTAESLQILVPIILMYGFVEETTRRVNKRIDLLVDAIGMDKILQSFDERVAQIARMPEANGGEDNG